MESDLKRFTDLVLSEMESLSKGKPTPDELQKAKAISDLGKVFVAGKAVEVNQARLLMDAGLVTEVAGVTFKKEDKDAHPKILKGGNRG